MKPFIFFTLILLGFSSHSLTYATERHDQEEQHVHAHDEDNQSHENNHREDDDHGDENQAHKDEHGHEEEGHSEEQSTRIEHSMAAQVGIETVKATSQVLHQTIVSYGSLSTGPEQLSHVRARYTGMIKSVLPSIGDRVKRGDLLARVESNESLKTYQMLAPISGTIIQRHANTGEVTQDQVLFSIANFDTLWAELRIYPTQQSQVSVNQAVNIIVNEQSIKGMIEHIIPTLDKPYQLARVKFNNQSYGLSPGLLIEGHIVIGEHPVALAVVKDAVQTMEGKKGVFVQEGEQYIFTPLQFGRSDEDYVEVLSGLTTEQTYVSKNSFLIRADIEKSTAEHSH